MHVPDTAWSVRVDHALGNDEVVDSAVNTDDWRGLVIAAGIYGI
jgi:hypothetical protein